MVVNAFVVFRSSAMPCSTCLRVMYVAHRGVSCSIIIVQSPWSYAPLRRRLSRIFDFLWDVTALGGRVRSGAGVLSGCAFPFSRVCFLGVLSPFLPPSLPKLLILQSAGA